MFEELLAQLKRIAGALWIIAENSAKGEGAKAQITVVAEKEDFGLGDEPEEPTITQNDVIDAARIALKADKEKFKKVLAKFKVAKISDITDEAQFPKVLAELKKIG